MGRNYKPHRRFELRFEGYLFERMENYIEKINKGKNKNMTKTQFIETAVEAYLNYLEDNLEIDRM